MFRNRLAASVSCAIVLEAVLGLTPLAAVSAQQATQAVAQPEKRGVETIVITAEKRSEDIQDVPLAVIAQSGDTLRENHVSSVQDLRLIDPSVQYRISNGKEGSGFSMRGVGTSTFAIGIEQSVATVVDGATLGDPSGLATLSDIDHVEVLKGPQGMLFGKNASAGVISIVTKNPIIGQWGGDIHASLGNEQQQIIEAAVNIPISDTLAMRISGARNHLDGWIYDPVFKDNINNIDDQGMRAKLMWRPNDRLKVVLGADFAYDGQFCCTQVITSTPNPLSVIAVSDAAYGVVASRDNTQVTDGRRPQGYSRTFGSNLNVDYDLGGGYTLTSILAYRTSKHLHLYDADFSVVDYVDVNGGRSNQRTTSEELRLASPTEMKAWGGAIDYVAGVFLFGQDGSSTIGDQVGYGVVPQPGSLSIPSNTQLQTVSGYNTVDQKSYAAFVQANWGLDDLLHGFGLTFGGRVTRDEIGIIYQRGPAQGGAYSGLVSNGPIVAGQPINYVDNVVPALMPLRPGNSYIGYSGPYIGVANSSSTGLASTGCIAGTTVPFPAGVNCFGALAQDTTANNFSWRITAQEKFTDSIMSYLTLARGYKGPGVSGTSSPNFTNAGGGPGFSTNPAAINQIVAPEIPKTVELGLKSKWLGGTLLVNADVFDSEFKNYQTQTNVLTPNGFFGIVANADKLTTKGLELNTTWVPIENLTFSFAGAWEKGVYGNLPVQCYFTNSGLVTNPTTGVVSAAQPTPNGGKRCGASVINPATGLPVAGQLNAKGNKLTNLPDFQYLVSGHYDAPNLVAGLTGHAGVTWNWQDDVFFNPNNNPLEAQKAYGILGAELGIGSSDDRWRISLYGTNILDQRFVSAVQPAATPVLNPAGYYAYISQDAFAHYGIRLDYTF